MEDVAPVLLLKVPCRLTLPFPTFAQSLLRGIKLFIRNPTPNFIECTIIRCTFTGKLETV